jgi:hypothetical protein
VGLLALAAGIAAPDQPPAFDELYHYFAAESWSRDGSLTVIDGEYWRSPLFTLLIGVLFHLFGPDIQIGRLPSSIATAALAGVLFWWCRRVMDRGSAWIAAVLLITYPVSTELSNLVRFYSIHALLVVIGLICVHALGDDANRPLKRRCMLGLGAAVCMVIATSLQKSTGIAVLAAATWCAGEFGWRACSRGAPRGRTLLYAVAGVMTLGGVVALALDLYGHALWREYRFSAAWSAPGKDNFIFYQQRLTADYPVLVPFLPIAVLIGLARTPRPMLFATTIFAIGVLAHSFSGMKADRYIFWLMPFFFAIWGGALRHVVPLLFAFLRSLAHQAMARTHSRWRAGPLATALAIMIMIFAGLCSPLPPRLLVPSRVLPPGLDWSHVPPEIIGEVRRAGIVLATDELRTAYYFGRVDVTASRGRVAELANHEDFTIDPRTGLPVVSSQHSLELIWECFDDGALVHVSSFWRHPLYLGDAIDFMVRHADQVPIDASHDLSVFRWRRPPRALPIECANLPKPLLDRRRESATGTPAELIPGNDPSVTRPAS